MHFIGLTPQEIELWKMFEPTATELGLELVRIKVTTAATPTLEILADLPNAKPGAAINLDQCAHLSRRLGRLLDVEETFPNAFNLEVSSPGIDRPYATLEAAKAAENLTVKAKLGVPVEGQNKLKGVLTNVTENTLKIGETQVELSNIRDLNRKLTENEIKDLMKGTQ